jgi:pSer/pThr/pTyr-binding forkhead associated (FHA) protein
MSPARLLALNGPLRGRAYDLGEAPVTLGRGADCEISIDLASISRRHAQFLCRGDVCFVRDLGSRNGIIVNGRAVREAQLRHGDVVTVGEIEMQFEAAPAGAVPAVSRRPAGREGLARAPVPPPPGAAPLPKEKPESVGLNLKLIAAIIATFVLSIVVGVLLLKLSAMRRQVSEGQFLPVLLKVGETKWVRVKGIHKIESKGKETTAFLGDFRSISVADLQVADASKYDNGELLIRGLVGGETEISLQMESGSIIRILTLVRGRLEDPLEALEFGAYSREERVTLAEQFLRNGTLIQDEKPYVALQEFEKAVAVLQPVPTSQVYVQARNRRDAAQRAVDKRWDELRQEISLAIKNNESDRAAQLLQDSLQLVPDPNDPRHQKSEWFLREIMRAAMAEKARGGR